jgi:DNA-directed RNA polymerase II subunit RPB1
MCRAGYIQRRLIKAMESNMVHYDGTIRNSVGQLVQLRYGEDGLDGAHVEFQTMPTLKPSDRLFEKKFRLDLSDERCVYVDGVRINCFVSRFLRRVYDSEVVAWLHEPDNATLANATVEAEWKQLQEDRRLLRNIMKDGNNKVLPLFVL